MSSEEIVKNRMPNAVVEEHTTIGGVKNWYVVDGDSFTPFAKGVNEDKAWSAAKEILLEQEQSEG